MQQNMGGTDQILRIVVGLILIATGIFYQSFWGAVGLIPLATALLGSCPSYLFLGINTCSVKRDDG